jgi:hypothetical protein
MADRVSTTPANQITDKDQSRLPSSFDRWSPDTFQDLISGSRSRFQLDNGLGFYFDDMTTAAPPAPRSPNVWVGGEIFGGGHPVSGNPLGGGNLVSTRSVAPPGQTLGDFASNLNRGIWDTYFNDIGPYAQGDSRSTQLETTVNGLKLGKGPIRDFSQLQRMKPRRRPRPSLPRYLGRKGRQARNAMSRALSYTNPRHRADAVARQVLARGGTRRQARDAAMGSFRSSQPGLYRNSGGGSGDVLRGMNETFAAQAAGLLRNTGLGSGNYNDNAGHSMGWR